MRAAAPAPRSQKPASPSSHFGREGREGPGTALAVRQ